MGLHAMYDGYRNRPQPKPIKYDWLVEFIDPDTGKVDRYSYTTQADAEHRASQLREDGIQATVIHKPSN